MPTDPVTVQLMQGLGALARSLTGGRVPADRVYVRTAGGVAPERDALPCLVVSPTPGRAADRRKLLGRRGAEAVEYLTVTLVGAADGVATGADPAVPAAPHWRQGWREAFAAAAHGRPAGLPAECKRVTPDGDALLDLRAFEAANLYAAAVPVRCLLRLPPPA